MKLSRFLGVAVLLATLTLPLGAFGQQTAEDFRSRGLLMEKGGDRDAALADYTKAIKLAPKFAPTYHARGNLKLRKCTVLGSRLNIQQLSWFTGCGWAELAIWHDLRGLIFRTAGITSRRRSGMPDWLQG